MARLGEPRPGVARQIRKGSDLEPMHDGLIVAITMGVILIVVGLLYEWF